MAPPAPPAGTAPTTHPAPAAQQSPPRPTAYPTIQMRWLLKRVKRAAARTRKALGGRLKEAEDAYTELLEEMLSTGELLRRKTSEWQAEAERADRAESDAEEATARLRVQLDDATDLLNVAKQANAELQDEMASVRELLRRKTKEWKSEAERADRAEWGAEEATARLRKQLDDATDYVRESEALIVEQGLRIEAQKQELAALRTEVKVLRRQVRQLVEASERSIADAAMQVRRLEPVQVNYRPFDTRPPQPPTVHGPRRPRFGPDSPDLLDLLSNTPTPVPERSVYRPTVADRVIHHGLPLVAPTQLVGFCGTLFHSAMSTGMLPGWSAPAGLLFAVIGSGVLCLTYTWVLRRNRIAAVSSVALLIGCIALSVSGHSLALAPPLAETAKEDGTRWAEEFDRLPCNDGTSLCPTWSRNN